MEIIKELLPLLEIVAPSIVKALLIQTSDNTVINDVSHWILYLLSKEFGVKMEDIHSLGNVIKNDSKSDNKLAELEKEISMWFFNVDHDLKLTT